MMNKYVIGLLLVAIPSLGLAQGAGKYQCSLGDLQRRVEILTDPGVSVPCEVHYYKDTEAPGENQVLWSAGSQEGYCESKAEEFITRLEGWGWDCERGDESMAAPEAAAETGEDTAEEPPIDDDTDVLSPDMPPE